VTGLSAKDWLRQIEHLPRQQPVRILNVCGGHERSISMTGLRSLLPPQVTLIPGPGCPVCVCPEEDIYQAISLAMHEDIRLLAFGDMLRVPVNVPKGEIRSLEQARAAGADIQPVASPLEVIQIARQSDKPVVFFAAGFETTMAPVAAMLLQGIPAHVSVLLSGRLTWPAVDLLLQEPQPGFSALVAPGHVATVMGSDEWRFVVERCHIPAAVAGFTAESLLAAFYSVMRQQSEQHLFLDNCYPELVSAEGNLTARRQMQTAFHIEDANWRGIGIIPQSGFSLAEQFAAQDARRLYPSYDEKARRRKGEMPPGCDCAQVVLGKKFPDECALYGKACRPHDPVGPCMVSDEGACRIWWANGVRQQRHSRPV